MGSGSIVCASARVHRQLTDGPTTGVRDVDAEIRRRASRGCSAACVEATRPAAGSARRRIRSSPERFQRDDRPSPGCDRALREPRGRSRGTHVCPDPRSDAVGQGRRSRRRGQRGLRRGRDARPVIDEHRTGRSGTAGRCSRGPRGAVTYPAGQARAALARYHEFASACPDELTTMARRCREGPTVSRSSASRSATSVRSPKASGCCGGCGPSSRSRMTSGCCPIEPFRRPWTRAFRRLSSTTGRPVH
jgi:hypothetical protein